MSELAPVVEPKKNSPLKTVVVVLIAAIAIVSGGFKMFSGFQKLAGSGSNPQVDLLLKESDAALDDANKLSQVAVPAFQQILNDFDQLGPDEFRKEKRELSENLVAQFAKTTEHFQTASSKLDAAGSLSVDKTLKDFVVIKSKSYGLLGKVCEQDAAMIRVLLDNSITEAEAITSKVLEIAASRDESQKAADDATAEADAVFKGNAT